GVQTCALPIFLGPRSQCCRHHEQQYRDHEPHRSFLLSRIQSRRSMTTFQSSPCTSVTSATGWPLSRLGIALTARYPALAFTASAVASASERLARSIAAF